MASVYGESDWYPTPYNLISCQNNWLCLGRDTLYVNKPVKSCCKNKNDENTVLCTCMYQYYYLSSLLHGIIYREEVGHPDALLCYREI